MAKKPHLTVDKIAESLRATGGIISHAATALGVHRSTISRRIGRSEVLKAVMEEATEGALDIAEETLMNKIKEGNLTAVIFFLKTKGRGRGYIEKHHVEAEARMTHDSWVEILENEKLE